MIAALIPSFPSVRQTTGFVAMIWLLALLGMLLPVDVAVAQSAERIQFAPGATQTTVFGTISAGRPKLYVLRASAGQVMTLSASYRNKAYEVSIGDANGRSYGAVHSGESGSFTLGSTGDYYLAVAAPPTVQGIVYYTILVSITGSVSPPPPAPSTAQRIRFAPGAISATVSGSVDVSNPAQFVLAALAGQEMTVQAVGGGPYRFTVTGADGSFLGRADAGGTVQARLPSTQDYYISFQAPTDVPRSHFALTVTVVNSRPAPQTERIQFAPGATSATVYDVTPKNYVLRALGGQFMVVELRTNGLPAWARVQGQDGQTLGFASESTIWSDYLPATQDYYLYVEAPGGSRSADFTLQVSIY